MKKYLIYICMLWGIVISCNDDDNLPKISPKDSGEWTDSRDNTTYGWIRLGNLDWMTSNLKYGSPYYENEYGGPLMDNYGNPRSVVSWYADFDFESDYKKYGNLYTWEEALEVCPEGWRLPTDEDWQNFEIALGMSTKEVGEEGWRGNHQATLLRQGTEGLGMALQICGCACLPSSRAFSLP